MSSGWLFDIGWEMECGLIGHDVHTIATTLYDVTMLILIDILYATLCLNAILNAWSF